MALTRDDIIAAYRRRIEQGSRTKLSKDERTVLAESFVDLLGYCQSEDDCKVLCEAEIALLEEGYPQGSIANQYLPKWRKAIAAAVADGRLPKQQLAPNEFGKTYDHWALQHLLYSNQVYQDLKRQTVTANNKKQDDLQPVRADRFIATARNLLAGKSPHAWAAGLLALTGRRFSEIVAMGQFWGTDHPYAIAFRGQLKKGILDIKDAETFLIATLVDHTEVIEALEQFRTHPRIVELRDLAPDDINSRLNTSVRHHIKRNFQDTGLVPILKGEKSVSAHNLRGVYGTIAIRFFCPPQQTPHRFVQAHLGHIIGEKELASRKNAGATEHYFHYFVVGAENQMLGDRGILLKQFGPLPTTAQVPESLNPPMDEFITGQQIELLAPIQELSQPLDHELDHEWDSVEESQRNTQTTMAKPKPSIQKPKKRTTGKTTKVTKTPKTAASAKSPAKATATAKGQRRSRTSVPADLMEDLKAIASAKFELGRTPTNADIIAATVSFLRDDTSPKMAASIDSIGTTMSWFTSEVDRLRGVIEGLESEVQAMRAEVQAVQSERDQAMDRLDEYQKQDQGSGHELTVLREENQALRADLQQFHQLKQLLGGGATIGPAPMSASGPSSASSSPASPSSVSPSPHSTIRPSVPTKKRVQDKGMALEAIDKAISRIIQWNNHTDRSFDEKWYISVPPLQDLLRGSGYTASQPRLKTAMDNRRQEIDAHHLTHGLGRRHNTRHQQPINEVMQVD